MENANDRPAIVFVVCHPDDEALWIGGLLHGLSHFDFVRTYVVCVSGADPDSPREREFSAAQSVAGYTGGVVMGGPLRPAVERLPSIAATTEVGLERLGVATDEISLLITHSPYGDEHMNPHHIQAYQELLGWTCGERVPFGFFSSLPLPYLLHRPLLRNLRREGAALHLLNFARCIPTPGLVLNLRPPPLRRRLRGPRYYLQFLGDIDTKRRILECYESINITQHVAGYAAFTSACESVYVFDGRGLNALEPVIAEMEVPGVADLFASPLLETRLARLARRGRELIGG